MWVLTGKSLPTHKLLHYCGGTRLAGLRIIFLLGRRRNGSKTLKQAGSI